MKPLRSTTQLPCLFLLTLCSVGSMAFAQRGSATIDRVVDTVIANEMNRQKIVGVSVGLISKSKLAYSKGYGYADLETKTPFTNETVLNWASNSKPVMAVLAMQLVEQGKLDLDASISNHLPDLPEHLHAVSARQLLCHQSGIPHYSNGKIIRSKSFDASANELDPEIAIRRFIESPLIFEPGTKRDYSSYAYVLLSAVVQAAGGAPIADQLAQRILKPLEMNSFQLDVPFAGQANWSQGYRLRGNQQQKLRDDANAWKHGAGAYKSDVQDFCCLCDRPDEIKTVESQNVCPDDDSTKNQ